MDILLIGLAGSLGAISRYLIYLWEKSLPTHNFPLGTLFINLIGCFLAGIVLGLAEKTLPSQRHTLTLISIGFIGSFTTFSTFGMETLHLIQSNQIIQAVFNILLNITLGIGCIWIAKTIIA